MITLKIKFSYQEPHKVDVSYRVREFTIKNEDEKNGFLNGLYAGVGTIYTDYEVEEEKVHD